MGQLKKEKKSTTTSYGGGGGDEQGGRLWTCSLEKIMKGINFLEERDEDLSFGRERKL